MLARLSLRLTPRYPATQILYSPGEPPQPSLKRPSYGRIRNPNSLLGGANPTTNLVMVVAVVVVIVIVEVVVIVIVAMVGCFVLFCCFVLFLLFFSAGKTFCHRRGQLVVVAV